MSRVIVDLVHVMHTCPGSPQPHTIDTRRTVVAVEPGGTCQRPRTVSSGSASVVVDCRRVAPAAGQCPACRTHIAIRNETFVEGTAGYCCPPVAAEPAGYPCRVCGEPVIAALADYGAHLLCRRWRSWRAGR